MAKQQPTGAQFRDWLIPSSIFAGIGASVFLYILAVDQLTTLLLVSAGVSFASIVCFTWTLFWSFTRLESLEIFNRPVEHGDVGLTGSTFLGILCVLIALVLLCFSKSVTLGIVLIVLLAIGVVVFTKSEKSASASEKKGKDSSTT